MQAIHRLLICSAIALAFFFGLFFFKMEVLTRIMISWDVFSLSMITYLWTSFFRSKADQIREQAKEVDESRIIIFIVVLCSILISLLGILIMLNYADTVATHKALHFPVSILGVILSWILLHTIFTVRYAHLYYGDNVNKPLKQCGGIDFPHDDAPDFFDFAYFAFIVGMTFQVADTNINSKRIRRMVLMHAIISFCFNTIIVALSIGIISGLKK